MANFDLRLSRYFSDQWLFMASFVMLIGIILIFKVLLVGVLLTFISSIVITTHYRLSVDFNNKSYHDYIWLFGLKFGDKGTFENIDYIFIKKSKVSQTINSRGSSTTIRKEEYDGYLKFSERNKIHLITKDSQKELIEKLSEIAIKCNTKIYDYSDGKPVEVEVIVTPAQHP